RRSKTLLPPVSRRVATQRGHCGAVPGGEFLCSRASPFRVRELVALIEVKAFFTSLRGADADRSAATQVQDRDARAAATLRYPAGDGDRAGLRSHPGRL